MPDTITEKLKRTIRSTFESAARSAANRKLDKIKLDPRIRFPCYKSLDDLIDSERLKSLDGYVTERIDRLYGSSKQDEMFYTGFLTMEAGAEQKPGSRVIYLSQPVKRLEEMGIDDPSLWAPARGAEEFPLLMDFIATLPFKTRGRMMIMFDNGKNPVTAHRDHMDPDLCHEFIWFRTNLNKPFFMLNHKTGERKYVTSYSAWFDTVNQFHGADAHEGLSLSIRVDGTFTDEFRKKFETVPQNRAATPSLWACTAG